MAAIVWFRRDLRVGDHPALRAALDGHELVVPFFCFDDRLLHGRHASGPRTQFLIECLEDLRTSLRERGSDLVVRRGEPAAEIEQLAAEVGATDVYFTRDVSPFARQRRLPTGLARHAEPGLTVMDWVEDLKPYRVFTPFHRAWEELPRREVLPAPRRLPRLPAIDPAAMPSLAELGLTEQLEDPLRGGERLGRERIRKEARLSPYLHFGCVSPREAYERVSDADFRRRLCWRDFYHHVLFHNPGNAHSEHQERYRDALEWSDDEDAFDAWCAGQTGFPLVDAAMRQLQREGWLPNRARLVVGSFLTKDLGIDWRRGERHFMRLLLDGDQANNNGNWQWIASVGTDPQPYFRRIYNPTRQMETHDSTGDYVRRYVPELRDVPDEYLREPWTMPLEVQQDCGVTIGEDYPEPIVDHREARQAALARYGAAAAGTRADSSRL